MFYIGENTINLIISLIEEIDSKQEKINNYYDKLDKLLTLKNLLTKSSEVYLSEREKVLEFLKNKNEITPREFNSLLRRIKDMNSHNFYRGINDDSIYASYVDYIDLESPKDLMELCIFKDKEDNTCLFCIPIIKETSKISNDKEFINKILSTNSQYMYFVKLKEYVDKCSLLKIKLRDRFSTAEEKIQYENEIKRYSTEMRTLKEVTKKFFKENKDIEERILSAKPNKKLNWIDVVNYSIRFYERTYLNEILDNAYEELEISNNKSYEYCNLVRNSLDSKINTTKEDIIKSSNIFKQEYILNYMDLIYPGIKTELIDSLNCNDKRRINYLKNIILSTTYLDDLDNENIKCL